MLDHPFVEHTGSDGRFELAGVPRTTVTLDAWRPAQMLSVIPD